MTTPDIIISLVLSLIEFPFIMFTICYLCHKDKGATIVDALIISTIAIVFNTALTFLSWKIYTPIMFGLLLTLFGSYLVYQYAIPYIENKLGGNKNV